MNLISYYNTYIVFTLFVTVMANLNVTLMGLSAYLGEINLIQLTEELRPAHCEWHHIPRSKILLCINK